MGTGPRVPMSRIKYVPTLLSVTNDSFGGGVVVEGVESGRRKYHSRTDPRSGQLSGMSFRRKQSDGIQDRGIP